MKPPQIYKDGKRAFPLHNLYAVQRDISWGYSVGLNEHRGTFVPLLGIKGELMHWWTVKTQT